MANSPNFKRKFLQGEYDTRTLPHVLVDEPNDLKVAEFVMGEILKTNDTYVQLIDIVTRNKAKIEALRAR